ncbi:alpha/beta fold hydrolase [uncultured Shewanella sp.]|uniref:alpha/beta fold hydrolase n=1 Tax=uncultured Shewanella sp. TaxID=173975 RepID=UPI002632F0B9|nr:alpha/beta fold hydrolase [uncultured Shewanella sp.]
MLKKIAVMFILCATLSNSLLFNPQSGYASELLPIIRFTAGLLNKGIFPQSDAYSTDDNILIIAEDNIELTANIFIPSNLNASAPAIIFINSWGLNEYEYLQQAAELAEKGYAVLSYTTRGFGKSEGTVDTAGPNDISDLTQVIDYLIEQYPVNPQAIGCAGISYGSGICLLGAAQDPRIKAVSAMSSWGSLVEALYGNQTPRLVWGELLTLSGELTGQLDPILHQYWDSIKSQQLEAIPEIIEWAKLRSPSEYVDDLNQNGTAIYFGKAYGDNLFQPNSVLNLFSQLTGPKHIDLVPGTHGSAEFIPSLFNIGENRLWENTYQWFDHHLKGELTDIATSLPVQMQIKFTQKVESFEEYPLPNVQYHPFYLHPRFLGGAGALKSIPYTGIFMQDDTINAWAGSLFTTKIPLLSQLLEQVHIPITANIPLASSIRSVYYQTDSLAHSMQIRGTPNIQLQIKPHFDQVQLIAYLYDMSPSGIGTLITHGMMTLPNTLEYEPQTLNFELITTAYDIPQGHQLVFAIDTFDPQYQPPTSINYHLDFIFSDSLSSILTIPSL